MWKMLGEKHDALGLKCISALFALFKEQHLLPSMFALQSEKIIAYNKARF